MSPFTSPEFIARREILTRVGSTNDVVRSWLADGTPEVCVAVADEQTEGRGREGRSWIAQPGAALLLSVGFRPVWMSPAETWQLAAVASLAMADAGERESGLPGGTTLLKWPNDLVVGDGRNGRLRKLAGVLGETEGLGTKDPRVIVGIGINVDWSHADFPPELAETMTSLREESGRSIDRFSLLERFLDRLEARMHGLRTGRFDRLGWTVRQATTGHAIQLETPTGTEDVVAVGVDTTTGALLVADRAGGHARPVLAGEVVHVRFSDLPAAV